MSWERRILKSLPELEEVENPNYLRHLRNISRLNYQMQILYRLISIYPIMMNF